MTTEQAAGRAGPAAATSLRPGTSAPAGGGTTRTWTIELPAGQLLISANHRAHWATTARITKKIRQDTGWMARAMKIPALDRAHVTCFYEPPNRRRRDPANWAPSAKAAVDGLVDAGVLPDDDAAHLNGPDMRLGPVHPGGRLVLLITELEAP